MWGQNEEMSRIVEKKKEDAFAESEIARQGQAPRPLRVVRSAKRAKSEARGWSASSCIPYGDDRQAG